MDETLTMLPEREARAALGDRNVVFSVLAPPYDALGCGVLRVLRVREAGERLELVAGYESYERIAPNG